MHLVWLIVICLLGGVQNRSWAVQQQALGQEAHELTNESGHLDNRRQAGMRSVVEFKGTFVLGSLVDNMKPCEVNLAN